MDTGGINVGSAVAYLDLDASKYTSGLKGVLANLKLFKSESASTSDKITGLGNVMSSVGGAMTKTFTVGIGTIATAAAVTGSKFDSAMSQVQATMNVTKEEVQDLRDAAIEWGSKTSFSATQAAEALNYLALAGYTNEQQIAALPVVLNLAAAGNMDLAEASDMVTDSLSALGLASDDTATLMENANRFTNQMATTASKSNTSVKQLGDAILTVGATARDLKGGTTELNTVLGILADNGTKGAEAGTRLRNIMLAMTPTTKAAQEAFETLNLDAYDAQGNLRPLPEIFQEMNKAMEGMTQKEKKKIITDIFNKADIADVNALLLTSADRWNELSYAIENTSDTAAADMAKIQLDNLAGDITLLKSAFEGLMIKISEAENGPLRKIIQSITNFIDKLNNLDESQLAVIEKIGMVLAAIGPVLLIFGKLASAIGSIMSFAETAGISFAALGETIGTVATGPVGLIIAAIIALIEIFKHLWQTNEDFRNKIISTWENIKSVFTNFANKIKEDLASLGIDFGEWPEKLRQGWEEFCEFFGGIFTNVFDTIAVAFEGILSQVGGIVDIVIGIVTGDGEKIKEGVKGIWDGIVNMTSETIALLYELVGHVLSTLLEQMGLTEAAEAVKEFYQKVADFFRKIPEVAKEVIEAVVEFFTKTLPEGWNKLIHDILPEFIGKVKEWFEKLPYNLGVVVGKMIAHILNFAEDFKNWVRIDLPIIINNIINWFKQLPGNIWAWLLETIAKVIAWAASMKDKAFEAGKNFFDKLIEKIKEIPDKLKELGEDMIDAIKDLPSKFLDKGREIIDNFIDGISEKIQRARELVSEFLSGGSSGYSSVRYSHKAGLDYVPYDGYQANLHKGERVLTAQENKDYSRGTQTTGDTYNFYDVIQSPYEYARAMKKAKENLYEQFA